jgi:hypothetical protein
VLQLGLIAIWLISLSEKKGKALLHKVKQACALHQQSQRAAHFGFNSLLCYSIVG